MKNLKSRVRLLTGVTLSVLCLPASADNTLTDVAEQETLVVTANRLPETPETVIPSLTVITRADIERLLAVDITDVLALVPGIDVVRSGPVGSATSVFVRGANSNHVLVLVDGVRVASGNTGAFAWEHLPVDQIERIEILRGPRASLYGSDAIGGVIQIFTRENQGAYASVSAGSYRQVEASLGHGQDFGDGRGHVSAQIGGLGSEGFSATNATSWFYHPDDDGYANLNASLKARWQTDWGVSRLSYLETRGDTDFDQGNSDSSHRTLGASIQVNGNNWRHELLFGANQQDLYTKVFQSRFRSERLSADWLVHRDFSPRHGLSLGLSWYQDLSQIGLTAPHRRNLTDKAAFLNWRGQWGSQRLEAAVRYDDFSQYDGQTTGNLGWSLQATPNWHLGASLGKAFRAPSLNEEFYYQLGGNGNQGFPLFPEKSLAGEINLQHRIGDQAQWRASIFKQKITDLIQFVPAQPSDPFSPYLPRNVAEADMLGLELDAQWRPGHWDIRANATIQDTLDKRADAPLLRRPDRKASLLADRSWGNFSAGVTLFGASKRADFGTQLPGFATLDLRFHYRINRHWRAGLKIHNLADRDYEVASGYNTPGRSGWLQLSWQQAQ